MATQTELNAFPYQAPDSSGEREACRVLVCDDDPDMRALLVRLLETLGYCVVGTAPDGPAAVRSAVLLHPDVVLMDVSMPGIDGIQASKAIMDAAPTTVVLCTASWDDGLIRAAIDAGTSGYLVKPLQSHQLHPEIVMALCRRRAALSREAAISELDLAKLRERQALEEAASTIEQMQGRLSREQAVAEAWAETFMAPPPALPALEIACRYQPAEREARVGGDFYDFIRFSHDRLGVIVGDVSGHGLAAAQVTAMARYMLRAFAQDAAPATAIERLNRAMHGQLRPPCLFLSVLYGVMDLHAGTFTYSAAGHYPPLLLDPDTGLCRTLETTGPLIGIGPDQEFQQVTVATSPGSTLVLYSDGIPEARVGSSILGEERLCRFIREESGASAESAADGILALSSAYAGGALQDDAVLLVLRTT
jgi:phosphoserine phosphatase RsbU/P